MPSLFLRDPADHSAGTEILRILGTEDSIRLAVHRLPDISTEIPNKNCAAPVFIIRTDRQAPRQPYQRLKISLAALSIDHGRSQNRHTKRLCPHLLKQLLCLQLGFSITALRPGNGVLRNDSLFHPVDTHRAQKINCPTPSAFAFLAVSAARSRFIL